jgi:hypothetical protein
MAKKNKAELKLGATVRLRAQSGEIIEGQVVHVWEEKSVQMVRVASGPLCITFRRVCWSMVKYVPVPID